MPKRRPGRRQRVVLLITRTITIRTILTRIGMIIMTWMKAYEDWEDEYGEEE